MFLETIQLQMSWFCSGLRLELWLLGLGGGGEGITFASNYTV